MQNPAFQFPDPIRSPQFYASVPVKRFAAWLIDTLISVILAILFLPFTAFIGVFIFPFLTLAIGFIYRSATIGTGSATWGMRVMSIELRDRRGERLDFSQALVHTTGFYLSFAMPLIQVVSVACMIGSQRGQSLTDMALGTVMINRI